MTTSHRHPLVEAAVQELYPLAGIARNKWWGFRKSVRKPKKTFGAQTLLHSGGSILFVRTSYNPDLFVLPGGGVKKSEQRRQRVPHSPIETDLRASSATAVDELSKETGISLREEQLRFLGSLTSKSNETVAGNHDVSHIYTHDAGPNFDTSQLNPRAGEIRWAGFVPVEDVTLLGGLGGFSVEQTAFRAIALAIEKRIILPHAV